jgi:tRNA1Val (adenine37-N6)-methyltransferase
VHRGGPVPNRAEDTFLDRDEVLDDLALRDAVVREVHLVGARDLHGLTRRLDLEASAHARSVSSYPRPMPAETTIDRLVGEWRIVQLKKGHRFSTDDFLTAWLAVRAQPAALRLLDLGAGIGSVGLMTLYHLPAGAQLTMVEAQEVSHALAKETIRLNALTRATPILGDLRDTHVEGAFDLVTGSPPYIPEGKGIASSNSQRAHARIELRGDVFDYCRAAARVLEPEGAFCFCHAAGDPRPAQAITDAGLTLVRRVDVYFRRGREPTIALFEARRSGARRENEAVVVREEDGEWTEQYRGIREQMKALVW